VDQEVYEACVNQSKGFHWLAFMKQFALLAALWLVGVPLLGETVKPPESFDLKRIDAWLESQVSQKGRVGFSVAIVKDGKIVFAKPYGYRSLNPSLAVQADTMFPIGSITKQFTSACVLLLAGDGRLNVLDPLSKYFPDLPHAAEITLLDLMNHTSGYPDYYPLDFVDSRMEKPISANDLIHQYAGEKLDFKPGSEWSYSNTGFIILGRVVEIASGQSFEEFLRNRILVPLEMNHTSLQPDPKQNVATGYGSFFLSPSEQVPPEANGWAGAAGALCSTPTDLLKWDLALIGGKVLKPEFYKIMTTARELTNGIMTGYGCGIGVSVQDGRTVLRHSGAVSGFTAINVIIPSTKSGFALLYNSDHGLGTLPDVLTSLLLKTETHVPKVTGASVVETVRAVFSEMQNGKLDRTRFAAEFNRFLSPEKAAAAAKRLKPLGNPRSVEVQRVRERGGMEVSTTRLDFATKSLEALMYRDPSGVIEQFFVDEK
jgi:CubicO group peptidase (beta-lactamase class C family)